MKNLKALMVIIAMFICLVISTYSHADTSSSTSPLDGYILTETDKTVLSGIGKTALDSNINIFKSPVSTLLALQDFTGACIEYKKGELAKAGTTMSVAITGAFAAAALDFYIDYSINYLKETGAFDNNNFMGQAHVDEYAVRVVMTTMKNMALATLTAGGSIVGQVFDQANIVKDSWIETVTVVRSLPKEVINDPQTDILIKSISKIDDVLIEAGKFTSALINLAGDTILYAYSINPAGGDIDTIDITQNQNANNTSNNPPVGDRPTTHIGNFTRIITERQNDGSHTGFQVMENSIDSFNVIHDLGNTINITTNPTSSYDADLSRITALQVNRQSEPDQYPSITGGLPATINKVELGHGYMEWGYWTASNVLTYNAFRNYTFDNRNYWIGGDVTNNAQMNSLAVNNIAGTYTGTAMGTFWTAGGGANMSGSFNSHVNFNTKTVSDFNLSVNGSGHTATISNASGTFSGSSSSFSVNGNTGQWKVDGVSADASRTGANGAIYGTNGKAIGGTWLISPSDSAIAYGIYRGTR
jgi:hypothetical protein